MSARILPLPGVQAPTQPITHYLRIGHTGHRQLEPVSAIWAMPCALERVPDHKRTRHFLDTDMAQADRLARQLKELKTGDTKMTKRLVEHRRRVEARRVVLENLYEARGDGAAGASAALRRGAGMVDDRQGVG